MAISETCPTTGQYCFTLDLLQGLDLGLVASKHQEIVDAMQQAETEKMVGQVQKYCDEGNCAVLALGSAIAIRSHAADTTKTKLNDRRRRV